LFVLSMCSFLYPHVKIVLFLGAFLCYLSFWIGVQGFLRYYRTGQRIRWELWVPVSLMVAIFEASLADRDVRMRYIVFNGFFVLLLVWGCIWSFTNARRLGRKRVFKIIALPALTTLLGVFRFIQGISGNFDHFWFYNGPGETVYRLGLFITLGMAALYELRLVNKRLIDIIEETHREHFRSQRGILVTIAGYSDNSQYEEPGHVMRVGLLAETLALALGWDAKRAAELNEAAQLHDLGKIGISDGVLEKSEALNLEELTLMRRHTSLGAEILSFSNMPLYQLAARIAAEHHENWDGSGYPAGMAGDGIALESRIVAICDVIDALSRRRSYKEAWDAGQIQDFLRLASGNKFDPELVDTAIRVKLWEVAGY
jgi:hypothetical protein